MTRRQKDLFPDLPDGKKYVSDIPELVAEWHSAYNQGKQPHDFMQGSGEKIWWQCSQGHEWEARIYARITDGSISQGCPYCAGRLATAENNLELCYPEILDEWDYTKNKAKPDQYTPYSGQVVWWRCERGHEWKSKINERTRFNRRCPYCTYKRPSPDYNLLVKYPDIAADWNRELNKKGPEEYLPASGAKVNWRCERGHDYKATIANRTNRNSGCPYCTKQSSSNEIRILSELEAIFADVRSRFKFNGHEVDIYISSIRVAIEYDGSYWHRNKSHQDKSKSESLMSQGLQVVRVREYPLPRMEPEDIILESAGPIPKRALDKIVRTICNGAEANWYVSQPDFVNDAKYRTYLDYFPSPFPEHSLASLRPDVAVEWDYEANAPLTPSNFSVSAAYNASWICAKGHKWQSRIATRTGKKAHGCGFCSGLHATSENNLAVKNPELIELWDYEKNVGIKPEDITPKSGKKVWWKCPVADDHSWTAVPYSMTIKNGVTLCPFCNGRKVSITNCLATTHPNFISIWHPTKNGQLNPWNVTAGSDKKVWFICANDPSHEYQGIIYNMTKPFRRKFCPKCKTK